MEDDKVLVLDNGWRGRVANLADNVVISINDRGQESPFSIPSEIAEVGDLYKDGTFVKRGFEEEQQRVSDVVTNLDSNVNATSPQPINEQLS